MQAVHGQLIYAEQVRDVGWCSHHDTMRHSCMQIDPPQQVLRHLAQRNPHASMRQHRNCVINQLPLIRCTSFQSIGRMCTGICWSPNMGIYPSFLGTSNDIFRCIVSLLRTRSNTQWGYCASNHERFNKLNDCVADHPS